MFVAIIIALIYIALVGYVIMKFRECNYDLNSTIEKVKSECNFKKKLSKNKGAEAIVENSNFFEKEETSEISNHNLTEEELNLKNKLSAILKKKDLVVQDGGIEKKVVPMEAIIFLTENHNPLVTEDGDINITISRDEREKSVDIIPKTTIKIGDEIVSTDDEELILSLNKLIKETRNGTEPIEDTEKVLQIEESVKEVVVDISVTDEPQDEVTPKESETPVDDIDNDLSWDIPDLTFNPEEELSLSDDDLNNMVNFDADDLIMNELSAIDIDDIEIEEEEVVVDKKEFYKKLEFMSVPEASFDFNNIDNSIRHLFKNSLAHKALMNNLAKTKFLVMNANKTVIVVDQNNILFAISKMFGMNSKEYLENFKNLSLENLIILNNRLAKVLELKLSDLTGGKENAFYLVTNDSNEEYYIQGFAFTVSSFKEGLMQKLDYFRSFPYNSEYTFIKRANSEKVSNIARLVNDINNVEIKS